MNELRERRSFWRDLFQLPIIHLGICHMNSHREAEGILQTDKNERPGKREKSSEGFCQNHALKELQ